MLRDLREVLVAPVGAEGTLRRTTLVAVSLAALAVQLGMLPVTIMLPAIASYFGVELSLASWVQIGYLMTIAALVLVCGRLGDIFGHGRVFTLGVGLYAVASVLAGLSQSVAQLIVARAFQGVGTAMVTGTSLALIAAAFPERQRGRAIAAPIVTTQMGQLLGVPLVGLFVQYLSWRWTFFALALVTLLTLYYAARLLTLERESRPARRQPVDFLGGALLFFTVAALVLSISHLHGGEESFRGGWKYHLTLQVAFVVLLGTLLWRESHTPFPLVPLRQFANRTFTPAVVANLCSHLTMAAVFFLMPFLLERGLGLLPLYTILLLVPRQVIGLFGPFVSGWLYDKTGSRWISPGALAIIVVSIAGMGILGDRLSFWGFVGFTFLSGIGTGLFLAANNTAIMNSLDRQHRGFASGMLETSRQLGHTLAVAVASLVMAFTMPEGVPASSVDPVYYIHGFRNAALVVSGVALIGVLVSLLRPGRPAPRTRETPTVAGET